MKKNKDFEKMVLEIARELGLDPSDIGDFGKFIEAVYNYIVQKRSSDEDLDEKTILDIVRQSKTLQEPFTAYMVLRMLEDAKYRRGFMDGMKVAKASYQKEIEEKTGKIATKVLEIFENQLIPQMARIFSTWTAMSGGRPQTQTLSIPIKFEESSESKEKNEKGGIKIDFEGEEKEGEEE